MFKAPMVFLLGTMLCVACAPVSTTTSKPAKTKVTPRSSPVVKPKPVVIAPDAGARPVVRGSGPAVQVSILVFSDFQCPFCSKAHKTIQALRREYGDRLEFVYMHNPLTFHPLGFDAAVLAMAADQQGKFWPVHDRLYAAKPRLTKDAIVAALVGAGVDFDQLKRDLRTKRIVTFIRKSQRIAAAIGASGTPAFFINGRALPGAQPIARFRALIDAELAVALRERRSGSDWVKARVKANHAKLYGYIYGGLTPPKPPPPRPRPVASTTVFKVPVVARDAAIGSAKKALVTMVVFSDFECPFCSRFAATQSKLKKTFGDKLRIVFKQFPLGFHKRAFPAAVASICANKQRKFAAYHDLLFANQRALTDQDLLKYARKVRLKLSRFKRCLKSAKTAEHVREDIDLASDLQVRGTPQAFINGRRVVGAQSYASLEKVIKAELGRAKKLVAKGIKIPALYWHIVGKGKSFPLLGRKAYTIDLSNAPALGSPGRAILKIAVYSDFECPYCGRMAPILERLQKHFGAKVSVSFKHFPLTFHRKARPAAKASVCAQAQGQFWPFHDKIFASQRTISDANLRLWAQQLGLNITQYDACLRDPATARRVDADLAEGKRVGVRGTPSIYINGRELIQRGAPTVRSLQRIIQQVRSGNFRAPGPGPSAP